VQNWNSTDQCEIWMMSNDVKRSCAKTNNMLWGSRWVTSFSLMIIDCLVHGDSKQESLRWCSDTEWYLIIAILYLLF
jgi:hypothetical protein